MSVIAYNAKQKSPTNYDYVQNVDIELSVSMAAQNTSMNTQIQNDDPCK